MLFRSLVYDLPLNEVVFDFYDRLKSISKGYASFDYQLEDYRVGNLVKMSILVNAEPVDALSMLVHADRAETRGRGMVEKMKDLIKQVGEIRLAAQLCDGHSRQQIHLVARIDPGKAVHTGRLC